MSERGISAVKAVVSYRPGEHGGTCVGWGDPELWMVA